MYLCPVFILSRFFSLTLNFTQKGLKYTLGFVETVDLIIANLNSLIEGSKVITHYPLLPFSHKGRRVFCGG